MKNKLTKALAITIISSMAMVGCATEKPVEVESTAPTQVQQEDRTETTKKHVEQDDNTNETTQQVNKPKETETTQKATETVKPNTTTKENATTKPETINSSNVIPNNTPKPDEGGTGWSDDGNYYNGAPVTENEKQYIQEYGHTSNYDDGEWEYNIYTGATRE